MEATSVIKVASIFEITTSCNLNKIVLQTHFLKKLNSFTMPKLLLLILTIIHLKVWAQNTLVTYNVSSQNENNEVNLIFNDTISIFKIEEKDQASKIYRSGFRKMKAEGFSYFTEKFMNVEFRVKDSLHNFKWELINDTITILNKKCFAAKTFFRGRTYIAYYSPDYPVSEGPWKFGGLPGLILSVKSVDKFVEWVAVKIIDNYSGAIEFKSSSNENVLDWKYFVSEYKNTVQKFIKLTQSNGTLSNGATANMKVSSIEIFYPELQTGEGIKF